MFESDGWWPSLRAQTYHYRPIEEDDDKEEALANENVSLRRRRQTRSRLSAITSKTLYTVLLVGGMISSFIVGKAYEERQSRTEAGAAGILQLRTLPIQLEYNATFGEAPTTITEAAWDNLLPVQGGFFQHPTIAPARSDFAVFHQLHCLNGIRQAFWFTHDAAIQGRQITDADFPDMISPRHMSHCIDLLRQSLMCQPDLTVEVKDELGGVTGFGTVHQCKDWGQFMGWMEEWETYGQTEPYVASEHHHQHEHHQQQ